MSSLFYVNQNISMYILKDHSEIYIHMQQYHALLNEMCHLSSFKVNSPEITKVVDPQKPQQQTPVEVMTPESLMF